MLVDHQIRQMMRLGAIVIDPFHGPQLMPTSYDLTLGPYFYAYMPRNRSHAVPAVPRRGDLDRDVPLDLTNPKKEFLLVDARKEGFIALAPGERVLGHTNERFGGTRVKVPYNDELYDSSLEPNPTLVCCSAEIATTSTAARIGISAHPSAGFGDPGYINRWTLEITNDSPRLIRLPVGAIIAQAVFHRCAVPSLLYTQRIGSGRYCDEQRPWQPEDMLPKPLKAWSGWPELYRNPED